jgi:PAS domain S-box-containing protein
MEMNALISQNVLLNLSQILILIDPGDLSVTYINRVKGKYRFEDLIGKPILNHILPEFKDEYLEVFKKVVREKQAGTIELKTPISSSPKEFDWYLTHLTPLLNEQGEVELVMSVSESITAQRKAEQEVIIKQKNLEAIINNTDDLVISIDRNRKLIEFNEVFRALVKQAYQLEIMKGDDVLTCIHTSKHELYKSIYERVFAGEKVVDVEEFKRGDQTSFYFEASFNPLYNHQNEIYGITIYTRNITERIQRDISLEKAVEEKEVLLSEIHHRIKNNLAVISSMLQIQSLVTKSPDIRTVLEETKLRIKSAAVVHELLYEQKQFNCISVKQFLSVLLEEIKKTYSNEKVHLEITGPDFKVNLDQAVPFALMMNEIYTNAFKHGFPNGCPGKMTTVTGTSDDSCSVSVYEDGVPFPDKMESQNGHSVGMILMNTFIRQLNGTIEFRRRVPKEIYLTFPIA